MEVIISTDRKKATLFYPHVNFTLNSDEDVLPLVLDFLSGFKNIEVNHTVQERRLESSLEETVLVAS